MRVIVCNAYGAPAQLAIETRPVPIPGEGEVLLETHAVGLGYVDALFVAGTYQVKLPLLKRAAVIGVDWGGHIRANPGASRPLIETLLAWYQAGRIDPAPPGVFPFEDAPAVLQALLDRSSIGKPVIRFDPRPDTADQPA